MRKEIELLENEPKVVADLLELRLVGVDGGAVVAGARGVMPVKADLAGVDALEQRGAAQQRGFAAAARADDGHDLSLFDAQTDVLQDLQFAVIKGLLDVIEFQYAHDSTSLLIVVHALFDLAHDKIDDGVKDEIEHARHEKRREARLRVCDLLADGEHLLI